MEKNIFKRICRSIFLSLFNLLLSRFTRFWSAKRLFLKLANINCAKTARIVGPIKLGKSVKLSIGENVWLGEDFCVYGSGECIIGNNCDIGPSVVVLSGSHIIGGSTRRAGKGIHYLVRIGNGVWIGGRSVIYGNITIGNSSIIAAGAVVNKDVDPNTIVGGIPSKTIKQIID